MKLLVCIQRTGFHLICYSHKQLGLKGENAGALVLHSSTQVFIQPEEESFEVLVPPTALY